jgi:hypothetical protein
VGERCSVDARVVRTEVLSHPLVVIAAIERSEELVKSSLAALYGTDAPF